MQKLKVGDTVQVMSGVERTAAKDRKRGKVLAIDRSALRVLLRRLGVLLHHHEPLDNDPVLLGQDAEHATALPLLFAGDHDHHVALAYAIH